MYGDIVDGVLGLPHYSFSCLVPQSMVPFANHGDRLETPHVYMSSN